MERRLSGMSDIARVTSATHGPYVPFHHWYGFSAAGIVPGGRSNTLQRGG